jgi:hypothetical protein
MAIKVKDILTQGLYPPSFRLRDDEGLFESINEAGCTELQTYSNIIHDELDRYLNPLLCPEKQLGYLASYINLPLEEFATRFGWTLEEKRANLLFAFQNLRNTGSPSGIKNFVEAFIPGSYVEIVNQPYKKVNRLSVNFGISSDGHIENKTYWRDSTVDVRIWNPTHNIGFLLTWLVDPRVRPYCTLINYEYFDDEEPAPLLLDGSFIYGCDDDTRQNAFRISAPTALSGKQRLSGEITYSWSMSMVFNCDFDDSWPMLANSVWRIDELGKSTHKYNTGMVLSSNGTISGALSLSGADYWEYSMNQDDNLDYFGGN